MVALLARLGADADRRLIEQRPDPGLARYARGARDRSDLRSRLVLDAALAYDWLLAGRSRDAVIRFQAVKDTLRENPTVLGRHFYSLVRGHLAVAYLRMGEQENCVHHHGTESCLLPIRGSGVHVEKDGSRGAIRELAEILSENPEDLSARWLLNLAHMTLGEYPEKVPERWLIPPAALASEADIGRFPEAAQRLGVAVEGLAGGSVLEDLDGDGDVDLMASSFGLDPGRDQLRLFWNDGAGRFSEATETAGLAGIVGGMNLVQADYDNDGHTDVLVLRGGWLLGELGQQPPSLLRNRGDGSFEDVTRRAGLLFFHPTQTAAWGDFDNDGWLDLFVGIESSDVPAFAIPLYRPFTPSPKAPCKLFRNNRDGTFSNVAAEAGLDVVGYVKGAVWGDYDNDGRIDLYVSQLYSPNGLYRNLGPDGSGRWRFARALTTEPSRSYGAWFCDYDNDGWQDLFVAGYSLTGAAYSSGEVAATYLGKPFTAERPRLLRNQKDGRFEDVTRDARLDRALYVTGGNFGDFDNDGWPDLYVATGTPDYRALIPNRMFRSDGGRVFQDVTTSAGVAHLQKGAAVSLGDIDGDGDLDVYVVIGGEYPGDSFQNALFLNPGHANHWLTLRLEGRESNRSAIGARIKVTVETSEGSREIHATVGSGGSFGASSLEQEIGLGRARAVRSVSVRWPATGRVETFSDVPMDRFLRMREGSGRAVPADRPSRAPARTPGDAPPPGHH